jgi:hypothetical protein
MSISAQAACRSVLTITRSCLAAGGTGGQNQNSQLPSGEPPPLPDMLSCSPPVSSTARTWKHGVIIGQYSPVTQGCPYSWTDTRSSSAVMLSITAVACRNGSLTARPARTGSPSHARCHARAPHR